MSVKIIAILACYNRREHTINCLESYHFAALEAGIQPAAVLLDDGSIDGTSAVIAELFPWVKVLTGDGTLYWNGGMRVAFRSAIKHGYDYYLWLNDDTNLFPDALNRLLIVGDKNNSCLVVGSVQDSVTKAHTYGGFRQISRIFPLKFKTITPDDKDIVVCDTFNGNCVLVPNSVVLQVGNLSADFTHGMGDFDYGLRAKKKGVKSIIAQGYYGECARNPQLACFDRGNPIMQRLKALHSPKGMQPSEWYVFVRRHAPYLWYFYMIKLYLRVIFP